MDLAAGKIRDWSALTRAYRLRLTETTTKPPLAIVLKLPRCSATFQDSWALVCMNMVWRSVDDFTGSARPWVNQLGSNGILARRYCLEETHQVLIEREFAQKGFRASNHADSSQSRHRAIAWFSSLPCQSGCWVSSWFTALRTPALIDMADYVLSRLY